MPSIDGSPEASASRIRVVLALAEVRVAKPHRGREQPGHRPVRARLPLRRDHRAGELHVEVAVGLVAVGVLHGRGGREHQIGVVGGVGEVLLVHHREEIFTREPPEHQLLVGRDRGRVRVVDVERLDRRRQVRIGERAPELDHVDHPRRRLGHQVRPLDHRVREAERAAGRQQRAARRMGVGPGQRGQARDGPARHAAVVVAGEPDPDPDERGARGPVAAGEGHDVRGGEPGDRGHALGIVLLDVLGQGREAERRALDVVLVHAPLADEHVHDAQGQGPVRPRPRHEMPVGLRARSGSGRDPRRSRTRRAAAPASPASSR